MIVLACNQAKENGKGEAAFLDGIWAVSEGQNALFGISGDKIFYFDEPGSSGEFEIRGDNWLPIPMAMKLRCYFKKCRRQLYIQKQLWVYLS